MFGTQEQIEIGGEVVFGHRRRDGVARENRGEQSQKNDVGITELHGRRL
jgi:hypothetical protein